VARPQKQTVDYFPHDTDASESKTLTIIQSKYGNDGYAFWFKLLQLLGKSPGHYFDFNKAADWEFLLAKTHIKDTETAKEILNTLSLLDAIDSELYQHGIIWCQKFVDRIADAYNRTVGGVPERPKIKVNVTKTDESADRNPENPTEMPQTKLKETKLNKTKIPEFIEQELWDAYLEIRKKKRAMPTDHAKVLLIKKLEEFRDAGDDPNEVLKRSIMNGWTGIFPLDKKGGQGGAYRQSARGIPTAYTPPEEARRQHQQGQARG